jgi:hypothetical protein
MTFEEWFEENLDRYNTYSKGQLRGLWQVAQAEERALERAKALAEGWDDRYAIAIKELIAERERSKILKRALDELLFAKKDSERGAGWDCSRAQRVWREAEEAVAKYEESQ